MKTPIQQLLSFFSVSEEDNIAKRFIKEEQRFVCEAMEYEAIEFDLWKARNNFRNASSLGEKYALFEGNSCASDYYTPKELYQLYLNQKLKP